MGTRTATFWKVAGAVVLLAVVVWLITTQVVPAISERSQGLQQRLGLAWGALRTGQVQERDAPTAGPSGETDAIVILSQQVTLLSAQVADLEHTVEAAQAVPPTQEPVSEAKIVLPPAGAIPLIVNDEIIGYTYPIGVKGPWSQSVPEGGFTLVACGNCTVDDKEATSDGTQGTVFLLVGVNADGSTPADLNETVVIDDYTLGHVQVTFIYAGNEDPQEAAASAVAGMFGPPNCGAEGCLTVHLFSRFADAGWETEVFRDPPG